MSMRGSCAVVRTPVALNRWAIGRSAVHRHRVGSLWTEKRVGVLLARLVVAPPHARKSHISRARQTNKSLVSIAEPYADTEEGGRAKQTDGELGSVVLTLNGSVSRDVYENGYENGRANGHSHDGIGERSSDVSLNGTATTEVEAAPSKWARLNQLASEVSEKKPPTKAKSKEKAVSEIDMDERERQRREKISKANVGKVPWNKGRKHSAETKARIRQRTLEAMKRPDIVEKLKESGKKQKHSKETRAKISAKLKAYNQRVKEAKIQKMIQLHGPDWEKQEEARKEEERRVKREKAAAARAAKRKEKAAEKEKAKANSPDPHRAKSEEHKRRISEAIAAKWQGG
mmetsp:Transcript_19405/g.42470  ORF Transcript_19405/g.42470 Transcript_19405/m.42470 type:complete len:344 (-) Transcript_19405:9-1040(-)